MIKSEIEIPDEHPHKEGRVCTSCNEYKTSEHFGRGRDSKAKYGVTVHGKCKPCKRASKIPGELKRLYGITLEQYWEMHEAQRGGCAICGVETSQNKRATNFLPLFIDHCHDTGHVRGLLCSKCNHALGLMNDSPDLLEQAAQYLLFSRI
jgi:hypothetical protein